MTPNLAWIKTNMNLFQKSRNILCFKDRVLPVTNHYKQKCLKKATHEEKSLKNCVKKSHSHELNIRRGHMWEMNRVHRMGDAGRDVIHWELLVVYYQHDLNNPFPTFFRHHHSRGYNFHALLIIFSTYWNVNWLVDKIANKRISRVILFKSIYPAKIFMF